ncbi:hypothetical protein RyT2_06390 [Pseudolactococcus yaeyamensis]
MGKEKSNKFINDEIVGYSANGEYRIVQKMRHSEKLIRSIIDGKDFTSRRGTSEIEELMEGKIFSFPKPIKLIENFLKVATTNNSIILDFFAGSATTADAVMQLNAEDGGNRKYILATLDEKTPENSEAQKAGYKTIDQISRERIRRAAKKLDDTSGFRALKVDNLGIREDIYKTADETGQGDLLELSNYQKEGRTDYDLLYDILIDGALEYNRKVSKETLENVEIIKYDYFGELSGVICYFGEQLTDELTRSIATLKPLSAVFKESTFNKSSEKVNVLEQFRVISPDTKVKVV